MFRGVAVPEEGLEDDGDVPRSRLAYEFHFTAFDQVVISTTWKRGDAEHKIDPRVKTKTDNPPFEVIHWKIFVSRAI